MNSPADAKPRMRAVFVVSVAWAVLSAFAFVGALASLQIDRSATVAARAENLRNLWPFWTAAASLWIGLTGMWLVMPRCGGTWRTIAIIAGIAIAARAAILMTHQPALSDDVYRYVFDGRNFAHGFNPYLTSPADRLNADHEHWRGEAQIVPLLAYPQLPTPYMPVTHYVFAALGAAVGDRWTSPTHSALVFRSGFVLIELALIALLFIAVRQAGRSPWWVALYAWHPLPLAEIAGSGHQDVIGIALLTAGLVLVSFKTAMHDRKREQGERFGPAEVWGFALLAMAAMVKPVAGPAGLYALRGRSWRSWVNAALIGILIFAAVALPLRWVPLVHSHAFANWNITASAMGEKWAHFAGVYEPLLFIARKAILPPNADAALGWNLVQETRAREICLAMLAIVCIWIFFSRMNLWRATQNALFAMVLLSTTAHPWYLLWAFALTPMSGGAGNAALWVYSLTISWGYVVFAAGKGFAGGEEWTVPAWVIAAAYVPVFFTLAAAMLRMRHTYRHGEPG